MKSKSAILHFPNLQFSSISSSKIQEINIFPEINICTHTGTDRFSIVSRLAICKHSYSVFSSDSCLIHFDGKIGPLISFNAVLYQTFLDCRRIWLTLDGEERNVAQRSLQFVSDCMESSTV